LLFSKKKLLLLVVLTCAMLHMLDKLLIILFSFSLLMKRCVSGVLKEKELPPSKLYFAAIFFAKLTPPLRSKVWTGGFCHQRSLHEPPNDSPEFSPDHHPPPRTVARSQRLKMTSQQPPQLPSVTSSQSLTATCQQHTPPLACPVIDKSATTSLPRVTQVPRHRPVTQISKNYIFAPKLFVITELPQNFMKLQNYPSTFKKCRITPIFF